MRRNQFALKKFIHESESIKIKMSKCADCKDEIGWDHGGFIWDELVFCEFCDPHE